MATVVSLRSPLTLLRRGLLLAFVLLVAGCASQEEKAQSYYERGVKLLSQHEYIKASVEFKNALQLKKNLVGAWRGLLEIEVHNQNNQGMVPILRNIVELDPKDVDAKLKLGHYLLTGNALDQALELANAAVDLDGKNANALAFRAAVLLKLNDSIGAKREALAALEIDPNLAEPLVVLAAESFARGDYEGALSFLNRQPAAHESDLGIEVFKLMVFERKGDLKQVEAMLQKLIGLYPKESSFGKALVKLYLKQNRRDEAETELRTLASANPSDLEAGLNVVRFLQLSKGTAAARAELDARTTAASGNQFKYKIALAEFDFAQGKHDSAIELLEKLVSAAGSPENTVAARVKLAQAQLSLGKYDAVDAQLAEILRTDSRNIDGLKLRATLRMQQGRPDEAITTLREGLNDQPRNSELMQLLATAYERSGSIELAEKQYADATKTSNFDPATTLNYAEFMKRRGDLARAENLLTDLVQRSPNNVAALKGLAEVLIARKNWARAQTVADAIQKLSGGASSVADQISIASLNAQGKYKDSIQILEGAHNASPNSMLPITELVSTLAQAQQLDRAVAFLQNVLKENPGNSQARVLLGSVYLRKNSPQEAMQSFRSAIGQDPKLVAAYIALADYQVSRKDYDEAEKVIREGLKQSPDDFGLHMALAGTFELKHDNDSAIAEYDYLLKQNPGSLLVANNLASIIADSKTDKASIERAYTISAMLRQSPNPAFKDTLGWIYHLRGQVKIGLPLLEEAAAALPNRSVIQYHLGMSYLAAGQIAKASEQFKKALAMQPDSDLERRIRAAQEKAAM